LISDDVNSQPVSTLKADILDLGLLTSHEDFVALFQRGTPAKKMN